MYCIEIRDRDLLDGLTAELASAGITRAGLTLIGATDDFTISTMPVHDANDDIVTEYRMPAEFHGTGEVVDGVPHVHGTFAVQGDRAFAGHVHKARVGTWFVRAYVIPVE